MRKLFLLFLAGLLAYAAGAQNGEILRQASCATPTTCKPSASAPRIR